MIAYRKLTLREKVVQLRASLMSLIAAAALTVAVAGSPALAKECYAPDALAQARSFSRAVITEGGKAVWLGGQTSSPDKNFEDQARDAFAALDKTIKGVGGTGVKDMVTMTVFIVDARYGDRLTEIRKDVFGDCFPASALSPFRASPGPDF
jgi:2-iminobutanoate/2-iminopropanoate deaminase